MIDARIPLGLNDTGSVFSAISRGFQNGQQIKQNSLRQELLKTRNDAIKTQQSQQEKVFNRQEALQNATQLDTMLEQLKVIPFEQRGQVIQEMRPFLNKVGITDDELISESFDDTSINNRQQGLRTILGAQQQAQGQVVDNKSIGESYDAATGETFRTVTIQNPDGTFRTQKLDRVRPEQPKLSALEEKLTTAGYEKDTPEYQAAARKLLEPRSAVNVNVGGSNQPFKIPNGFMLKDPSNPSLGVTPIPGSSQDALTTENAGKATMLEQGAKDIAAAKNLIYNQDGSINKKNLASSALNVPFSEGRTLTSLIENAVNAKLRAETGATATPAELESMKKRFQPNALDSKETIDEKLSRLESFLSDSLDKVDPSNRFNKQSSDSGWTEVGGLQIREKK